MESSKLKFRSTSGKGVETPRVYLHGIDGTKTHVHLAMNIEPHVTISELVGELKGSCSHDINKRRRTKDLQWQRGYGVVSFGKNNLDWVLDYIGNQKAHHAKGEVHDRLERITAYEDEYRGEDA